MGFYAGIGVWFGALLFLSNRQNDWKGHFGRNLVKLPGLRSIYRLDPFLFFLAWWLSLVFLSAKISHIELAYWVDAARRIDDYLNHDDDSWRRYFDAVRNKVKWKMELPPEHVKA